MLISRLAEANSNCCLSAGVRSYRLPADPGTMEAVGDRAVAPEVDPPNANPARNRIDRAAPRPQRIPGRVGDLAGLGAQAEVARARGRRQSRGGPSARAGREPERIPRHSPGRDHTG